MLGVQAKQAGFRLDARPLDREAVRRESQLLDQRDVVGVPVVAVAAVARHVDARRVGRVLPRPPVVVPVAAFDLVRGRGDAPEKVVGESIVVTQMSIGSGDEEWRA